MTISHVQDVCGAASADSVTVSISSTGGNTLIAVGRFYSGSAAGLPSSITDTAANTWQVSTSAATNPPSADFSPSADSGCFVAWCIGAGAVTSVTFSAPSGVGYSEVNVSEWSGVASNAAGDTVAELASDVEVVSPSMTITAGDLMIGIAYPEDGASPLGTLPSGTTALADGGDNVNWAVWQKPSAGSAQWDWDTTDKYISAVAVFHATGGTSHTATAGLTVTPSFSVARTRGKYRTGALTVTPSFSAARTRGKYRTAALTVAAAFSAARQRGRHRTASLTVTPQFTAAPGSRAAPAYLTAGTSSLPGTLTAVTSSQAATLTGTTS